MKITDKIEIFKGKKAKNRIWLPPMDTLMSENGMANEFHIQHYGSIAYGGVGTIITESTAISSEGKIRAKDLGIWSDDHIEGHKSIVKVAHLAGALIGTQLNHAGAKAEMADENRIGATMYYDYLPQETLSIITEEQLKEVEDNFVAGAKRAKTAGYDFVEIHAAHGYLLSELLHKKLNTVIESDDILVRGKAVINIVERISKEVGIPIGIRISFSDHDEGGMEPIDFKPIVEAIEKHISYFNVSSGETTTHVNIVKVMKEAGTKMYRMPIAEEVKKFTNKPVVTASNVDSREDIEVMLSKKIDGVLMGRENIFRPHATITEILTPEELTADKELYHWNNNIWFNFAAYANLQKTLKEMKNKDSK